MTQTKFFILSLFCIDFYCNIVILCTQILYFILYMYHTIMVKAMISYQIYIIIGIVIFPIFAFIIYFTKNLIDRAKFVKTLHDMKNPLIEKINSAEVMYETEEKKQEINSIVHAIKNDVISLRQEIDYSQKTNQLQNIDQIEKDIAIFYENMNTPPTTMTKESYISTQQIYQQALAQKSEIQEWHTTLQKQQAKIMNENISKFLLVYKEKDKAIEEKSRAIDEKNKSIYVLQKKLNEAEQKLKIYISEQQTYKAKDAMIQDKEKTIALYQQRIQEVENKFKSIALLHKSITEKEQIKDNIIEEKNRFIINLQNKLHEIEQKIQAMITINEDSKEKSLNKKLIDIDQKIQTEKRKNFIFIVLFILFLLISICGFIFVYTYYIQNASTYII